MKLRVVWIGRTKETAIRSLTAEYLKRLARYVSTEGTELASEAALLKQAGKRSRPGGMLVLLDGRGKQLTSEQLAEFLRQQQERGTQELTFAVGPADGFSEAARGAADVMISLGQMTLAHELARVVLLEQLYRAFTILKGHPYHLGH